MRMVQIVAVLIPLAVAILLVGLRLAVCSGSRTEFGAKTTDAELEKYFALHQSEFEGIRKAFAIDRFPGQIWQGDIGKEAGKNISIDKVAEYQNKLRLLKIFRIDGNESYFEVTMVSEGDITTNGCLRGYVHFTSRRVAVAFSPLSRAKTTLKELKDGWSLYRACSAEQ